MRRGGGWEGRGFVAQRRRGPTQLFCGSFLFSSNSLSHGAWLLVGRRFLCAQRPRSVPGQRRRLPRLRGGDVPGERFLLILLLLVPLCADGQDHTTPLVLSWHNLASRPVSRDLIHRRHFLTSSHECVLTTRQTSCGGCHSPRRATRARRAPVAVRAITPPRPEPRPVPLARSAPRPPTRAVTCAPPAPRESTRQQPVGSKKRAAILPYFKCCSAYLCPSRHAAWCTAPATMLASVRPWLDATSGLPATDTPTAKPLWRVAAPAVACNEHAIDLS